MMEAPSAPSPSGRKVAGDLGRASWQATRFLAPRIGRGLWWLAVGLVKLLAAILIALLAILSWLWRHRPVLFRDAGGDAPATDKQKDYLADLEDKSPSAFDGLTIREASERISGHVGR
jgi:hypothetical protein